MNRHATTTHTMKKTTKTNKTDARIEAIRAMPHEEFEAKAAQLLAEATGALMALETMREARRTKA